MDPIHPILPQPVNIPPVMPSPGVGRVDRDGARDGRADQQARREAQRRRRELQPEGAREREDDAGSHVDVTA